MNTQHRGFYEQHGINLVDIGQGVLRAMAFDDQIVFYVTPNVQRSTVDILTTSVLETVTHLRATAPERPFYSFYDFTQLGMLAALTPYFRQRINHMASIHPDNFGRYAVIAAQGAATTSVINLLSRFIRPIQPNMHGFIFSKHQKGLDWLLESLNPPA